MPQAKDAYKAQMFKEEVAKGLHLLHKLGHLPTPEFGDVSVRDAETNRVYISMKPGTFHVVDPLEIHGCDTAVVELDGTVVEDHVPPSDTLPLHLAIYRARPEITTIVRAQTAFTAPFAQNKEEIQYVLAEQGALGGSVRNVGLDPVFDEAYCKALLEALDKRTGVTLYNRGAMVLAGNVDRAVSLLVWLESVCRKTLRASVLGRPIVLPPRVTAG